MLKTGEAVVSAYIPPALCSGWACLSARTYLLYGVLDGRACQPVHTSCMVFWMGVPVSRSRFLHLKPSRIFQRTLSEQNATKTGYTDVKRQISTCIPACKTSTSQVAIIRSPSGTLDGLCLVQNHVVPENAREVLDVLNHQLVAGDDDVKRRALAIGGVRVPELA